MRTTADLARALRRVMGHGGRGERCRTIQMVPPSMIHGIEVHGVATMPAEFHSSQCGAVFVWTK
ncbi:hypothetical protein BH09GEM1_BH09GEM1_27400 [soil metagenome]